MKEYPKIQSLFKRDPTTNHRTFLEGEYSLSEFEYLKDNIWEFSEKIDGTCIRVMYTGEITFGGKTNNAQISTKLFYSLTSLFSSPEKFQSVFNSNEVCLYGEGYGCLSSNTGIILDDYSIIPISNIVNKKLDIKVLTYNFDEGRIESSSILNYFKYDSTKLIRVELEKTRKGGRGRFNQIVCTENHLIYTENGYREARDILPGEKIMVLQRELSPIQEQILYGTLLGDASISSRFDITISHSNKQIEYIELLKNLFGNVHITENNITSGYGSSMLRISMSNKELFKRYTDNCIVEGKKVLNSNWLNKLTPISLAFWYMDDGSIRNEHRKNQIASIYTQGFSCNELSLLQDTLFNKYQIRGSLIKSSMDSSQCYLKFNTEESKIFFILIAPYIIKSLKYKLPYYLREVPCIFDNIDSNIFFESRALKSAIVKNITEVLNDKIKKDSIYDIETKNKNYFIGPGFLVHNSGIQTGGKYRKDQSFVLFDVKVGEWWLRREDVEDVAKQFNIGVVPIIGEGTLFEMVEIARKGFKSKWGDFIAEGIVARPKIELQTRGGDRIITKIKYKDFVK